MARKIPSRQAEKRCSPGMARLKCLAVCLCGLALVQGVALAAEPPAPVFDDVELQEGGRLIGQVADVQGNGLASVVVSIEQAGRQVARTTTDRDGYFTVTNLPGGPYAVAAGTSFHNYRLWAPGTAPPVAHRGIFMLVDTPVVRGQSVWFWTPRRTLAMLASAAGAVAISQEVNKRKPGSP